jgi:DNA repair protein RadA/Sms
VVRARATSAHICQACGASFPRWEGQCRDCGSWNSLVETIVHPRGARRADGVRRRDGRADVRAEVRPLGALRAAAASRQPTGIGEVDRILGGGLVAGSLLLLGGEPGIGKSTLVLQIAAALARAGAPDSMVSDVSRDDGVVVLYASAEESAAQLHLRASRLGVTDGPAGRTMAVLASTDVEVILEAASARRPALLVVDSIQAVALDELEGPAGSVGQVRAAAARLGAFAHESGVTVLLVGHVTKDGSLAGPRSLEHLVDAVLTLEGERYGTLRLLRALKNRHGATDEVGVLEMTESGMQEVADTATAFLGHRQAAAPGTIVAALLEGSRPLLVEVQALVAPAGLGPPRRVVAGLDRDRLALLIAVLARRGGIDISGRDVYASLTGGLAVAEPALDLPLALAIASSQRDQAIPAGTFACGEVSLLGEIRPVPGLERRLREATRLGFRRAIVPEASTAPQRSWGPAGLELVAVGTLRDALVRAFEAGHGTTG